VAMALYFKLVSGVVTRALVGGDVDGGGALSSLCEDRHLINLLVPWILEEGVAGVRCTR
jgi:hypothetical protein